MRQRLFTGVLGGAGFVALLVWGGYVFAGLLLLLSVIGMYEYNRMNRMNPVGLSAGAALIGTLLLVFPWSEWTDWSPNWEAITWVTLFVLFSITVISKNRVQLDQVALLLTGMVYIGAGFQYMLLTRLSAHGLFWTLLICACIALTDSGAYFTGKLFGRTKLWPSVSPNKTVEGAFGGVVVSIIAACCFSMYAPDLLTVGKAVQLGLIIAIVGQLGDLVQSAYKRVRGIKDTGSLLPGHGGVLDRFDSWLIVFPFIHLLALLPH